MSFCTLWIGGWVGGWVGGTDLYACDSRAELLDLLGEEIDVVARGQGCYLFVCFVFCTYGKGMSR